MEFFEPLHFSLADTFRGSMSGVPETPAKVRREEKIDGGALCLTMTRRGVTPMTKS